MTQHREQRGREENGITRRELDAIITPVKEDVKETKTDVKEIKLAVGVIGGKITFAQGAIALLAFMLGAGVLTMAFLLLMQ